MDTNAQGISPGQFVELGPGPAFDALLFDLDGTLVGSGAVWFATALEVARRFGAANGVAARAIEPNDLAGLFGLPAADLGRALFPTTSAEQQRAFAHELESELGATAVVRGVSLMPGAIEMLTGMSAAGVRMGIATNAGQSYLQLGMNSAERGGLGLGRFVEQGRCLDSPGVGDKADMLGQLLEVFGTRSALMVGDTTGDARSASRAGVPFVHFAGSGAPRPEGVPVAGSLGAWGEFAGLVGERTARLREFIRSHPRVFAPGACIQVVGLRCSGASLLARDLARAWAAEAGQPCGFLCLDETRDGPQREDRRGASPESVAQAVAGARKAGQKLAGTVVEGAALCQLDPSHVPGSLLLVESDQEVRRSRALILAGGTRLAEAWIGGAADLQLGAWLAGRPADFKWQADDPLRPSAGD